MPFCFNARTDSYFAGFSFFKDGYLAGFGLGKNFLLIFATTT